MKYFQTILNQDQASQIAARGRMGRLEPGRWSLFYRPAWFVGINATLKRIAGGPRIVPILVFIDRTTGLSEECRIETSLMVDEADPRGRMLAPAPSLTRLVAEGKARDIAFQSILRHNHTLWMPVLEVASVIDVGLPLWAADHCDGLMIWVDAVSGGLGRTSQPIECAPAWSGNQVVGRPVLSGGEVVRP